MFNRRALAVRKRPYAFEYITDVIKVKGKKYYKLENCNDLVSEDNIILNSNNWIKDIRLLKQGNLKECLFNNYIKLENAEDPSIIFPDFKFNLIQYSKGYYLITVSDGIKDLFVNALKQLNNTILDDYIIIVNFEVIEYLDFSESYQYKDVFFLVDSYVPKWSVRFNIFKHNYVDYLNNCNNIEHLHELLYKSSNS